MAARRKTKRSPATTKRLATAAKRVPAGKRSPTASPTRKAAKKAGADAIGRRTGNKVAYAIATVLMTCDRADSVIKAAKAEYAAKGRSCPRTIMDLTRTVAAIRSACK